jgi:hypothetical protein
VNIEPNVATGVLTDALRAIPPVRHALEDPHFKFVIRPIDDRWHGAGVSERMAGFNPITHSHYFASSSPLRAWLNGETVPEDAQEAVIRAALAMAHDYLHSWAYRALEALRPDVGFDSAPVTPETLEEFTGLYLLTEAVACVGLDHWCLSVLETGNPHLERAFAPLTTHYRERFAERFRRANPGFDAQHPEFFTSIVQMYRVDAAEGFELRDVAADPMLRDWLTAELLASRSQRATTRLWLSGYGGLDPAGVDLGAELAPAQGEELALASALGALLWRKIKGDEPLHFIPRPQAGVWRYPAGRDPDYRLCNLGKIASRARDQWAHAPRSSENFRYFAQQAISRYVIPRDSAIVDVMTRFHRALIEVDANALSALCTDLDPVEPHTPDPAPLELVFVN